jgi:hypothetical protein
MAVSWHCQLPASCLEHPTVSRDPEVARLFAIYADFEFSSVHEMEELYKY